MNDNCKRNLFVDDSKNLKGNILSLFVVAKFSTRFLSLSLSFSKNKYQAATSEFSTHLAVRI